MIAEGESSRAEKWTVKKIAHSRLESKEKSLVDISDPERRVADKFCISNKVGAVTSVSYPSLYGEENKSG